MNLNKINESKNIALKTVTGIKENNKNVAIYNNSMKAIEIRYFYVNSEL